jgi:hypothetical protein
MRIAVLTAMVAHRWMRRCGHWQWRDDDLFDPTSGDHTEASLIKPDGPDPFPAVVLMHGST